MKKRTLLVLSLAVFVLMALFLVGCTQDSPAPTVTPDPTPAPTEPATQDPTPNPDPEPEPDTSVTIVDIVGRTVTLDQPARRIVGTHNPTMNIAVILGGGGEYIAGFGNKAMAANLWELVFPELLDPSRDDYVPQIGMGREINFEMVIAQGADLAILPERFAGLADDFEELGIPAAVILPNDESFDTIKQSIELLGVLVGEEERAAEIIAFYAGIIDNVREIAAGITDGPRAIFTGSSSPTSVANGLMLQSVMLETVGAVNVARDVDGGGSFIEVSMEEIIGWNPEVIFIPAYANFTVEELLSDPAWAPIDAIRNGRVYMFPSALDPWDFPTPSTAMGLTWLLNNMFPELYSLDQVIANAAEYYELVYGQAFSAEQLGLR